LGICSERLTLVEPSPGFAQALAAGRMGDQCRIVRLHEVVALVEVGLLCAIHDLRLHDVLIAQVADHDAVR
jgi:hypothetical protein